MVEVPYVNVVQTVRTMVQTIQVLPIPKFEQLLKFEVDMTNNESMIIIFNLEFSYLLLNLFNLLVDFNSIDINDMYYFLPLNILYILNLGFLQYMIQ